MELIPIHTNFDHKNLVNIPPFITNNPVHEKLAIHKIDFKNNELDLFRRAWGEEKKENNFLTACIVAAFAAILGTGIYILKKIKHL